jgi:hypothetical protein
MSGLNALWIELDGSRLEAVDDSICVEAEWACKADGIETTISVIKV